MLADKTMRLHLIPLTVSTVIILTSLSECQNPFSTMADSPISAEINGVLYSSPGHKTMHPYSWPTCTPTELSLWRLLYSEDGGEAVIHIIIKDTLVINKKYTNARFMLGGSYLEDNPGVVELTDIKEHRISGKFEFIAKNPETGEIDYKITNGKFDVRY